MSFRCIALYIGRVAKRGGRESVDRKEERTQSHSRYRAVKGAFGKVNTEPRRFCVNPALVPSFLCVKFLAIFLEKMRLMVFWCAVFGILGILNAATLKRDVTEEKKGDEDIYGELDGTDLQKDGPPGPEYYDEDVDDPEQAEIDSNNSDNVKLLSHGEDFIKEKGETVTLPCRVSPKDTIRMWKKNATLIFQDRISITSNKNYNLTAEGDLQMTVESDEDYDSYACVIVTYDGTNLEVVHNVVPKTAPAIKNLFVRENKQVFDLGDSFTITCEASGYPKPAISWHKDNQKLGTEGASLTISNAKAKHAGAYRCLADNKVGNPAHGHLEIQINHPPIVSVDKYLVNSDHGQDAELVCDVKAYPAPSVVWQRNEVNVKPDGERIQFKSERNNERNLLIIKKVSEKDFGTYACVASNPLGKQVTKKLNLIKTPVLRQFKANQHQDVTDAKVLQWKVESKQPISKHELQYRRKGDTEWKTINPEVGASDSDVYVIKHTLNNLEPGIYETRARSRNTHGWSDYSNIVPFEQESGTHHHSSKLNMTKNLATSENDDQATPAEHRTEDLTSVGESTSGSATCYTSLALLVLVGLVHIRQ